MKNLCGPILCPQKSASLWHEEKEPAGNSPLGLKHGDLVYDRDDPVLNDDCEPDLHNSCVDNSLPV